MKRVKNDNACILCRDILTYLNILIETNATARDFEKALDMVCSVLPSEYHSQCNDFVHTYAPILVELIAELDDPNVVCQQLSLCSKFSNKNFELQSLEIGRIKSLPCNLCEYIVNYLDGIIQSNSTETKFEEALDKACKGLPSLKLQSECHLLVHLYGVDLIKLLVEYGDPKSVCQAVGICDK